MADSANEAVSSPKRYRFGIWVAIIVGIAALLSAFIFPLCSYARRQQTAVFNFHCGLQIFSALEKYAQVHAGRFPQSLQELIPQYVTEEALDRLAYMDLESSNRYEWIYFPGVLQTSPPETLVLASPRFDIEKHHTNRIVIRADGSNRFLSEKTFREQRPDRFAVPKTP